jgi:hypothetical protein
MVNTRWEEKMREWGERKRWEAKRKESEEAKRQEE